MTAAHRSPRMFQDGLITRYHLYVDTYAVAKACFDD